MADIKALQIKVSATGLKPAANGLGALADAAIRVNGALPGATKALDALDKISFQGIADQTRGAAGGIKDLKDAMNNVGDGGKLSTYMSKMALATERIAKAAPGMDVYIKQLQQIKTELEGIAATGAVLPKAPRAASSGGGAGGTTAASDTDKESKQLQRTMRDIERQTIYLEKGKIGYLEYKAAQLGAAEAAAPYIARMRAATSQTGEFVMGQKQMSAAMRMVPAQFTDIATQLAGGQSPFLILMQQGGQLKDMFGGIGPAMKAVGTTLMGYLTNPFIVAAGAIAGATYALYQASKSQLEFSQTIARTNNLIGLTYQSFQSLARTVGESTGSFGLAKDALMGLAATGVITNKNLQAITTTIVNTSRVTGQSIDDIVKSYASIAKDPINALLELNKTQNFLTVGMLEQVRALENQGKAAEASALALEYYQRIQDQTTKKLEKDLPAWEKMMLGVKSAISQAADEAGRLFSSIGKASNIDDEIKKYDNIIAAEERRAARGQAGSAQILAAYRAEREALLETKRATETATKAEAARTEQNRIAVQASTEWNKRIETGQTKQIRMERELAKAKADAAALEAAAASGDKGAQQLLKTYSLKQALADIEEKYADKTKSSGVAAVSALQAERMALEKNIAGMQKYSFEYEKATENQKQLMSIQLQIGNRNTPAKEIPLLQQKAKELESIVSLERQQAALKKEVSIAEDWAKTNEGLVAFNTAMKEQNAALLVNGAEKAKLTEKELLLQKALKDESEALDPNTRALAARGVELAKIAVAEEKLSKDRTAANKVLNDTREYQAQATASLADYTKTQQEEAYQMNMSNAERKIRVEWLALEARKNQELAVINARIVEAQKLNHTEEIARLNERKAAIEANYAAQQNAVNNQPKRKALEGESFSKDAQVGFDNFYDSLTTRQQEFQSFYSSSYSLMTDTLDNFFQTGKLNGREFVVSMMKLISKMIAQMLVLRAVQAAVGMGTSSGTSSGFSYNSTNGMTGYADGAAFSSGMKVNKYANGAALTNGVYNKPTYFANGGTLNVLGEEPGRSEAVMPLMRMKNGDLGVQAVGGGGGTNVSITVNVSADGTTAETTVSDAEQAKRFGNVIKTAVLNTIAEQQRPGGMLATAR